MYRFIASLFMAILCMSAVTATAQSHISKTSAGDLMGTEPSILDWKTNEIIIPFDLPETVWVDKVEVLISARPTGALRHRRNLHLRINGSDPIILKAQGQRFDARVKLAQKHLRRRGNKLYISGISTSSTCAGPNHAGWEINKERSLVVFYGRNMTRDLNMRDLVSLWNQPATNPSVIGLKVVGEDKFRHESLITQAMTLRTGQIPRLHTAFSGNKIDIIAGTRQDVKPYIRRVKNRTGDGAQIILDESRPPRLILTGDTAEEVRASVDAFATHKLPVTRRTQLTPYELTLQPVLSQPRTVFDKRHKLSDAGILRPTNKWITPPLSFNFDTPYASQRSGEMILRLNGGDTLSDTSSLDISLNGQHLGKTQIDAKRKTVRLNIPDGYLIGTDNKIEITPDLLPSKAIETCDVAATRPEFSLGLGSKIMIKGKVDKSVHDISNFAASTGPFASSKNVVIYGTSRRHSDRLSTLRLMGQMAHISGKAWTHANFIEGANPVIPPTDNVLIVGPKVKAMDSLLTHAPKALRLALNGQKIPDLPEEQRIAGILKVAAVDADQAFQLAAARSNKNVRRYASGLMALHDDPDRRQTIGIISTRPGASFSTAAANLLKPEIWNNLSGSVAQWGAREAHMVQTAQPKKLLNSQPLDYKNLSFDNLPSFSSESLDNLNDKVSEALYDIWHGPVQNTKDSGAVFWASLEDKWASVFTKDESSPRELRDITPSQPEPNTLRSNTARAPEPAPSFLDTYINRSRAVEPTAAATQVNVGPQALKLRGAYTPNESTSTKRAYIDFDFSSSNAWNGVQSAFSGGLSYIKSKSMKLYNNFDQWSQSINKTRVAKGENPVIPSPLLALLLLIFGCLILMAMARPHQLKY